MNMHEMPGAEISVNDPMPDEPRTELGYAHRLIHVYGDRLRYVPVWRRWLAPPIPLLAKNRAFSDDHCA